MRLAQWIDRLVETVSPESALRRSRARTVLSVSGVGYNSARRSSGALSGWSARAADAQDDINPDLPTLRARSRDLTRNSPLACGAINTTVTSVVGTGLSCRPQPDASRLGLTDEQATKWSDEALFEWRLWSESTSCDVTRGQSFFGLQSLAFRSALESGDVLCLLTHTDHAAPYTRALQLIEADRLCNPNLGPDNQRLSAGVSLDAAGAPSAYHVCSGHPDSRWRAQKLEWAEIPARIGDGQPALIHLFDRRRPGQVRGVPVLAPVIEHFRQLGRYTEAELQAAVVSGTFAVFVRMDAEAFGELFDADSQSALISRAREWDGNVATASLSGNGKAVQLLPGESVESTNPGRPNAAFDPFVLSILRQIGVALELPYEVLVKHFTASYSAARAALLDAWRFYRCRRDWLAMAFCQPVYAWWLDEAVAIGRVHAPGYFADPAIRRAWQQAVWIGDGPGSIDPLKEVDAAIKRIDAGISTIAAESILHDGTDWRTKHAQRVVESRARREAGLSSAPAASAPAAVEVAEP